MSKVYPSESVACENVLNLIVSIFVKNVEPDQQVFTKPFDPIRMFFLAHPIRISEILPWDRKSFLAYQIRISVVFTQVRKYISHTHTSPRER